MDFQPQPYQIPAGNTKKSLREVLFNEVTLVLAIGGFIWGVFNYLNAPAIKYAGQFAEMNQNIALIQQSIQTIQLNHEAHIQEALTEIAENKQEISDLKKEQVEQSKQIVRLLTIIERR